MALQLRRGTNTNRLTITPAQGEPIYNTDTKTLYIGDGVTAGGNPVSPVTTVNGLTGNVSLTTDTVGEGSHNLYFTTTRADDAVGAMLASGTLSGVAITYNNTTHTISISTTGVIPTGSANSLAYWATSGTTLSASQNLIWSETTNVLQNLNGTLFVTANNGNRATVIYDNYNITGPNALVFRKAHGTNSSPGGVAANEAIHNIVWQAHDGFNFVNTSLISGFTQYGSTIAQNNVQGTLVFSTTDSTQLSTAPLYNRLRIDNSGQITIGPYITTEPGSGQLVIRQTVSSNGKSPATVYNIYSDIYGATFGLAKARGSYATPTAVAQNDNLGAVNFRGYTGSAYSNAASIRGFADGAPVSGASGYVPGYLSFLVTSSAGILNEAMRISNDSSGAYNGNLTVNGTLTVNGATVTTNTTTVNVEDKLMKLGYLTNGLVSTTGIVGSISGSGPWTATISNMTDNIDLNVGSAITATGTGTTGNITLTATTHATASCTAGNISGTTFTVGGTTTGTFAIGMQLSGGGISPGTYIVSGSGITWTLNISDTVGSGTVTGTQNTLTVSSTSSLQIGTIITTPSAIGGLATSTNYYVNNIVSSTQCSVTTTPGSTTDVTLTSATGSVSLAYANGSLGSGGTYIVTSIPNTTSITITATGGTTPIAGPITNITTSGATDSTANGGGIQVYGATNKTFIWNSATTAWTSSENINLVTGKTYEINGTSVLTSSTILPGSSSITTGAAGVTENLGANTGNSTLNIYGNGTSGTATITTNVTTGTANLFAGVTGSVNIGGITWTGANNTALIINNGGLQFSSASSVAAAGTNQGTATQLYADNNFITSGTGGVVLPAATTGREVSVTNNTGASINVYPQGTHTIESGSAGVPTVLPNLATISLMAKSGNNWWTIQPVYNGGTGVSITQSANGTVTWNIGQAVSTTSNVTFANVQTTGLTLRNVNFIAVASTATYALSTTTSYNVLVVSNTGLTVTVTMPPSPVDQQLCSFTIASNTVSTLNMTAGPTVIPPFTGTSNVTSGTVYQYVYRASTTTWYRN